MHFACTDWAPAPRPAPPGQQVFAIGDVHGHAAELRGLQALMFDAALGQPGLQTQLVYLGDYIDRGPDSAAALDALLEHADSEPIGNGLTQTWLVGNHEQYLLSLIDTDADIDREFVVSWYDNGGIETMKSLGVEGYGRLLHAKRLPELQARLRLALGAARMRFLQTRLQSQHQIGDYLFVHAGIDVSRPLDDQEFTDLLLMREPFLSHVGPWPHPVCVVHGHTVEMPTVKPHRIGVDAGCWMHGALCAVQIVADQLRFIAVTQQNGYPWQASLGGRQAEWAWRPIDQFTAPSTASTVHLPPETPPAAPASWR